MFKSLLSPGRSKSLIPGLSHNGASSAMRKILSSFGSGWQGIDKELGFSIQHEKLGLYSHLLTLKKGEEEAGYLQYTMFPDKMAAVSSTQLFEKFKGKGHGKELYREAMWHARSQGAKVFRSDTKIKVETGEKTVSEDAARVWASAEKAGIAEKITGERGWQVDLLNLGEKMLKLGEGSAISKAGTGTIPSILKNTSRIIRNVL